MHFARLAGLNHQAAAGARFFPDQMMMHIAHRQQRRDRHVLLIHAAIGKHQDRDAVLDRLAGFGSQFLQSTLHARRAFAAREQNRQRASSQPR